MEFQTFTTYLHTVFFLFEVYCIWHTQPDPNPQTPSGSCEPDQVEAKPVVESGLCMKTTTLTRHTYQWFTFPLFPL